MMIAVSSALYHGVLTWLPPESHLKSTILAGASCENLLLSDFLINIQIVPIVMICDQIHNRMLFCKGQLLTMCLGPGNFQCQNISSALPSLQRWTVPWSREFQSKISIVGQKIFVWNNHNIMLWITWPGGTPISGKPLAWEPWLGSLSLPVIIHIHKIQLLEYVIPTPAAPPLP